MPKFPMSEKTLRLIYKQHSNYLDYKSLKLFEFEIERNQKALRCPHILWQKQYQFHQQQTIYCSMYKTTKQRLLFL